MQNELILLIRLIIGFLVAGAGVPKVLRWFPDVVEAARPGTAVARDVFRPIVGGVQVLAGALVVLGIWPYGSLLVLAAAVLSIVSGEWNRALWGTATRTIPAVLLAVSLLILAVGPGQYSVQNAARFLSDESDDESAIGARPRGRQPVAVPRRAIVGVAPGARAEARASIARHGGRVLSLIEDGNAFIVATKGPPQALLAALQDEPGIVYAEPDYIVTTGDVTPNDSKWSSQWGLRKIQAPSAWETSRGSKTVVVGVIDSGIDYKHEDLAGRMWTNPGEIAGNGKDDDGNGWTDDVHGADCYSDDGDPMDDNDHGTHVAGTIGAATNNVTGVAAVDWNVKIMALKFIGPDGSGKTSDAIQCIDYAIKMGAHLTNNSWGGAGYSQALYDAIARASAAGDVFVAAAGNSALNLDTLPSYPASYDLGNVISVGASDSTDALAVFSNFGTTSIDIAAPGVGIISTTRNNGYATWNGTSMAAPHVAGAAALLLSGNIQLTPANITKLMIDNADQPALLIGKVADARRLNVARAIQASSPAPAPSPTPSPTPSPSPSPKPTPKPTASTSAPATPTPTPPPSPGQPTPQQPSPTPQEPQPAPEEPGERSYAPDAVTVTTGASRGNPVSNLESDDGRAYRIMSRRVRKGHAVDWFATTLVDPSATELTVTYDGSYSRSASQTLFLFDFSAKRWERMSRADVATSDRAFTIRAQNVQPYVSAEGHVRLRVRAVAGDSFTARADMVRFTIRV